MRQTRGQSPKCTNRINITIQILKDEKWAEDPHRYLSKKNKGGQKAHETCSISLIIREMETKTLVKKYHITLIRRAII